MIQYFVKISELICRRFVKKAVLFVGALLQQASKMPIIKI